MKESAMELLQKIVSVPRRALKSQTKKIHLFIKGVTVDLFPPETKQKPTIYTCMHELHAYNKKRAEIQNQKIE